MDSEKDYYLEELRKVRKEYLEIEQKLHNYCKQFSGTIKDGVMVGAKPITAEVFKKMEKLRKEVENKRKKYDKANEDWKSFLSRYSQFRQ